MLFIYQKNHWNGAKCDILTICLWTYKNKGVLIRHPWLEIQMKSSSVHVKWINKLYIIKMTICLPHSVRYGYHLRSVWLLILPSSYYRLHRMVFIHISRNISLSPLIMFHSGLSLNSYKYRELKHTLKDANWILLKKKRASIKSYTCDVFRRTQKTFIQTFLIILKL